MRAWLMPNGAILCVDQGFMDYAGWAVKVGPACAHCLQHARARVCVRVRVLHACVCACLCVCMDACVFHP